MYTDTENVMCIISEMNHNPIKLHLLLTQINPESLPNVGVFSRVLAAISKWQKFRKFSRRILAPLMVTYHYVIFYVYHYPFRSYQH